MSFKIHHQLLEVRDIPKNISFGIKSSLNWCLSYCDTSQRNKVIEKNKSWYGYDNIFLWFSDECLETWVKEITGNLVFIVNSIGYYFQTSFITECDIFVLNVVSKQSLLFPVSNYRWSSHEISVNFTGQRLTKNNF